MILKVWDISKSFGGLKAVSNVSFCVNEGEIVGIIGPNGSGKTTLFNLITGFLKQDTGGILFDGREISGLRPDQICNRGIARTFQIPKPLPRLSILKNVLVGVYSHMSEIDMAQKRALNVLELVGLSSKKDVLAEKIRGAEIRRLELARALSTNPQVLLIDEIAAGVNPTEANELIRLIRELRQRYGMTILIIDHVLRVMLNVVDRLVVLHHGKMILEGPPDEVISHRKVTEVYLGEYDVES
jgi:ABC-type branched-subunit amino acid transport system ATPase component